MARRILVGLSGGVDSAVAAALLKEQGWEVAGVTLQVWAGPSAVSRGCCALEAVEDADAVCEGLGIPYRVVDVRPQFLERVILPFAREYAKGRTPNPCIECNRSVKFHLLLDVAREMGADAVATGHYARITQDPATGRHVLLKGLDASKDQSYVLYPLTQDHLARIRFPLGSLTKEEVRRRAEALGLPVARKPDSQEICFVPHGGHGELLARLTPQAVRPGPLLNTRGEVLGTHRGLGHYTVGQRRGLGVATGQRQYVVALDPERNAVVVGSEDDLLASGCRVTDLNWIAVPGLEGPCTAWVKYRYATPPAQALLEPEEGGTVRVSFLTPQKAVAPGQAAVFYHGDRVLGGGTIAAAFPRTP